jgi:hypothetical protein
MIVVVGWRRNLGRYDILLFMFRRFLDLFLVFGRFALGLGGKLCIRMMMTEAKISSSDWNSAVGTVAELDTSIPTSRKAADQLSSMLFILLDGKIGRLLEYQRKKRKGE